mmetsp:Transcript_66953/g.173604  ORF Transcript_66953/g.173604 Transcript_66953/m.173604 type:complete len:401 (-) Transcript_66953:1405-2607(-)
MEGVHGISVRLPHLLECVLPELVYRLELGGLGWQLPLNVLGREDALQVHPSPLHLQPLVDGIRSQADLVFPNLDVAPDALHKAGAHHGLDLHGMVFKLRDDVSDVCQDPQVSRIPVIHHRQRQIIPSGLNLLQLLLERELAAGLAGDLGNQFLVLEDVVVDERHKNERTGPHADRMPDAVPVPVLHGWVAEVHDDWHVALPLVDFRPDLCGHSIPLQSSGKLKSSLRVLDDLLVHLFHVQLLKFYSGPILLRVLPLVDQAPQLVFVGEETLGLFNLGELKTVGNVEQGLVLSEESRLLLQLREACLNGSQLFKNALGIMDRILSNELTSLQLRRDVFRLLFNTLGVRLQVLDHLLPLLLDVNIGLDYFFVSEIVVFGMQNFQLDFIVCVADVVLLEELVH